MLTLLPSVICLFLDTLVLRKGEGWSKNGRETVVTEEVSCETEEEVFKFLGLPFCEPSERDL